MSEEKFNINVKIVPIENVMPNDWNPNVQDDKVFDALVENIMEVGMDEPLLVRQLDDDTYQLVNGEHRYEACRVLGFDEVPIIVARDFDDDMAKFQTVRRSVLKGRLDPVKFTKLFNEMADKYGEEATKQMMQFVDDAAFDQLYIDIKKDLPKDIQEELDKKRAQSEVKTVDDLSRILNELFSKYGDTLNQNFMVFTYGGKTHLWVVMSDKLKKEVETTVDALKSSGLDINMFFEKLLVEHGGNVMLSLD